MGDSFRIIPISTELSSVVPGYQVLMHRDPERTLLDSLRRPLCDMRISVTDRCNLRCIYCMPKEVFDKDHVYLPRNELLTFQEVERLARIFVRLGVKKIRLTGGEPLLRNGIEHLIEKLARLQTDTAEPVEIALTTNGALLAHKAQSLKDAGLSRVTVSLDGLSDATFQRMSGSQLAVATVLKGIAAAQATGLGPVKINMVIKRGVNEHEIVPMAEHFRHSAIVLRFIEFMDVGSSNGWRMDDVVSAREILDRIAGQFPIVPLDPNYRGEVARRWRYADGGGEFGVIAAVTNAFCHECSRVRLSTEGKLYTCLFASEGVDLRTLLRQTEGDRELTKLIADGWNNRTDQYSQQRHTATRAATCCKKVEMSYIGG
jgi:GTP 3',8-cyclase